MDEEKQISQELFEQIENYLLDKLSSEERAQFEKEIAMNSDLAAEIERQRLEIMAVEERALEESLNEIYESQKDKSSSTKVVSIWKKYAAAASIVMISGLTVLWLMNRPDRYEKLFTQHFEIDAGLPTNMSGSENYPFYRAMADYKNGDYQEAIAQWKDQLLSQPNNDSLIYFLGVSHLATKNTSEAIRYLTSASNQSQSVFQQNALLNLGLSHLKNGKPDLAAKVLLQCDLPKAKEILTHINE